MQVQLSPKKRVTIAALFSTRIMVVVCTAISLARYSPFFHSSPIDQPWQAVDPLIWTQAVLGVSIITACVPGLKRVLADLRTGFMAGAVTELYELSVSGEMGRSCLSDTQNSNKETASRKGYPGENSFLPTNNSYQRGRARCDYKNKGNTPKPLKEQRASSFATGGSRKLKTDSVENLTDNEIIQTMEYEVRYEDRR
ncbi:hypothetical protein LOZ65_003917 [Ophidiomyces ophidiicola]|nr:hypothetical protein LOZ65_003917 [Ophidiomyces ophidiicola]